MFFPPHCRRVFLKGPLNKQPSISTFRGMCRANSYIIFFPFPLETISRGFCAVSNLIFYIIYMERKYRIYRYTNILNGMKYDGATSSRWQSKRAGKDGENYIKMCRRFGEAILEYGWPNFKYEVLEDGLTKEEAKVREKYWIEHDNSIWPNGYNLEAGGKNGHSVNDDTKKRMLGHKCRYDVSKPVQQFTKDGQFKSEYPSITEASRQTGVNRSGIQLCVSHPDKHFSAGGYLWKRVSICN